MTNLWLFVPMCALLDRAWGGGLPHRIGGGDTVTTVFFMMAGDIETAARRHA